MRNPLSERPRRLFFLALTLPLLAPSCRSVAAREPGRWYLRHHRLWECLAPQKDRLPRWRLAFHRGGSDLGEVFVEHPELFRGEQGSLFVKNSASFLALSPALEGADSYLLFPLEEQPDRPLTAQDQETSRLYPLLSAIEVKRILRGEERPYARHTIAHGAITTTEILDSQSGERTCLRFNHPNGNPRLFITYCQGNIIGKDLWSPENRHLMAFSCRNGAIEKYSFFPASLSLAGTAPLPDNQPQLEEMLTTAATLGDNDLRNFFRSKLRNSSLPAREQWLRLFP